MFFKIVDPMLVFEFIHRIMDILTDYLGEVSESSIRENFVTVYQVCKLGGLYIEGCVCLFFVFESYWRK